jgi:hypothetical protein
MTLGLIWHSTVVLVTAAQKCLENGFPQRKSVLFIAVRKNFLTKGRPKLHLSSSKYFSATGIYYLATNADTPYAQG